MADARKKKDRAGPRGWTNSPCKELRLRDPEKSQWGMMGETPLLPRHVLKMFKGISECKKCRRFLLLLQSHDFDVPAGYHFNDDRFHFNVKIGGLEQFHVYVDATRRVVDVAGPGFSPSKHTRSRNMSVHNSHVHRTGTD
jgi:hypothetical protein